MPPNKPPATRRSRTPTSAGPRQRRRTGSSSGGPGRGGPSMDTQRGSAASRRVGFADAVAVTVGNGSTDDRRPRRGSACLDDVAHDARHVVRSPAAKRKVDERVDSLLGVGDRQGLAQGVLAHHAERPSLHNR